MAQEAEKANENRIVFMSDVWLDLDDTFDKLATVFEGTRLCSAPNGLQTGPHVAISRCSSHQGMLPGW